jgi:hypothetical protein
VTHDEAMELILAGTMMECGHAAQATHRLRDDPPGEYGIACVICMGSRSAITIKADTPDLTGRTARCAYFGRPTPCRRGVSRAPLGPPCDAEKPSAFDLPFFAYRGPGSRYFLGESDHDEFYCGCWGWD